MIDWYQVLLEKPEVKSEDKENFIVQKYDGINRYWVIESNEAVLKHIDCLNSTKSAQSVTMSDF